MKTYTITEVQLKEWLEAVAYGGACLADNGRGGASISRETIITKLQKAQADLSWLEFEGGNAG